MSEQGDVKAKFYQVSRELESVKSNFRNIIEKNADGMIIVDAEGIVRFANPAVLALFGCSSDDLMGTMLGLPMVAGEATEINTFRSDGQRGTAEMRVTETKWEGDKAYLASLRDVTERKQMEEKLNEYSEELEQRLKELQTAYKKLQELDKMKDSFLSTVSHELRTPLTSIKSFTEILLTYDHDEETKNEFLSIINGESDRLTRLITDFLDLSKIEAGKIEWQSSIINLKPIIETAVATSRVIAVKMNLDLQVDLPEVFPSVWGDRDRFVQVVTNLIGNSIKFTPDGGEILVRAEALEGDDPNNGSHEVKVSVIDNGLGIDAEDQENIFQKFTQVGDTLTDKPAGTGLGLAICREILEHYSGSIWVESELGKGSTFSFVLPVAYEDNTVELEAELMPEEMRGDQVGPNEDYGSTILIVDDEENIRRFLSHELTRNGYRVIEAANGREAIDIAREYCPDLITLDVMMPDISGFDVTKALKHDPVAKDIPVIIVSVMGDKQEALRLGADDYVTKPFETSDILDKINALLGGVTSRVK